MAGHNSRKCPKNENATLQPQENVIQQPQDDVNHSQVCSQDAQSQDNTYGHNLNKCGRCGEKGHNKKSCKGSQLQYDNTSVGATGVEERTTQQSQVINEGPTTL